MTNEQLYMAIGLPILFNLITSGGLFVVMTVRFRAVEERLLAINQRFDDMRDLWRAELRRVEEVLDARLRAMEERRP